MKEKLFIVLLLFISTLFLFASYIPNFYEASVVDIMPQDRIMLWGEHIYTYDYNVYLSKMRQGTEGRWSVVDKYDNHPKDKGVFLQMIYLISGKIGGVLHLTPILTFHLLRTIVSFLWILAIIYLNVFFLKKPKWYTIGILLSLLAASFPVFYKYQGSTWVGMHMSWWTEMDVLKRISYIPHYTLNYIIVALLSVLLYKFETNSNDKNSNSKITSPQIPSLVKEGKKGWLNVSKFGYYLEIGNWKLEIDINFIWISVILFVSFFIHPAGGILFFFSWFLFQLILFIWNPSSQIKGLTSSILQTIIFILVALIPLLYLRSVTSTYPWKSLTDFDHFNRIGVDVKEYVLSLGPIFFTGVLGAILVLIKKEKRYLSLVTWVLGAFAGIYIFKKLPFQSELRFVQTANHIPLAILTVYFFKTVYDRFKNKFVLLVILVLCVGIMLLGIVQSYFSIRAQTDFIHQRAVATQPLVPYPSQVMYPLKDFWNGLLWLEKNTSRDDIVLSQVTAGNYIPAYADNFVYIGHNPESPHYNERVNNVNQFFLGTMSEKDAHEFLQKERISYIFYGPQEKEKSLEDIKKYLFLKTVFNLPFVKIYQVEEE